MMNTRVPLLLVSLLMLGAPVLAQQGAAPDRPLRVIDESELGRYLAALRDLVSLGDEVSAGLGDDPSKAQAWAAGLAYEGRAKQALESHGFTPDGFVDVHWNAMMAYVASEMAGHRAEMEQARQQQQAALESMKGQLSPEQYQQMLQGMAGMQSMTHGYDAVPPANVELLKKHRAELAAILER